VLYSSKTVTKETMQMASCFGRPSPDPRFGSSIELRRGCLHRLFDLIGIGKTLSSKGIASEEAPSALLQIEPTSPFGNEHMLETRMFGQPSACFQAVVTTEIVRNEEDVPLWIVRFDVLEQFNVVLGIARSCATGDLLAVTDP
jgi:hypothetical protein